MAADRNNVTLQVIVGAAGREPMRESRSDGPREYASALGLRGRFDTGRILPRPHAADLPFAAFHAATSTVEPPLTAVPEIAREKIAADAAVLGVGRSERRDGAACAGLWIFPWHADVLAAFGQNLAGYRARDRKVSFRRRFRDGFRGGEVQGPAMLGNPFVRFGKQIVQLIGEAAARKRERKRTRTSPHPTVHRRVR